MNALLKFPAVKISEEHSVILLLCVTGCMLHAQSMRLWLQLKCWQQWLGTGAEDNGRFNMSEETYPIKNQNNITQPFIS